MDDRHRVSPFARDLAHAFDLWLISLSPQSRALWAKSGDESGSLSLPPAFSRHCLRRSFHLRLMGVRSDEVQTVDEPRALH